MRALFALAAGFTAIGVGYHRSGDVAARTASLERILLHANPLAVLESLSRQTGDGGAEPARREFESGRIAALRAERDRLVDDHRQTWPADRGVADEVSPAPQAAVKTLFHRCVNSLREVVEGVVRRRTALLDGVRKQVVDENPITLPRITPGIDQGTVKGQQQYDYEQHMLPSRRELAKAEWRAKVEQIVAERRAAIVAAAFREAVAATEAKLAGLEKAWAAGPR